MNYTRCIYYTVGYIAMGIIPCSRNIITLEKTATVTVQNRVITYKRFWMYVHHANDYQSSLLTLLRRLVRTFITRRIIMLVY